MIASDLILQLQQMIKDNGDLKIEILTDFGYVQLVHVNFVEFEEPNDKIIELVGV